MAREKKRVSEDTVPVDKDAETAVIGSVLMKPDCIAELNLSPQDFFYHEYRVIFNICLRMWQRGEPINEKSVYNNMPEDISAAILPAAISQVPTSAHASYFANRVRECAVRRRMRDICQEMASMAINKDVKLSDLFDNSHALLESLSWPSLMSRFIIFRNGAQITTKPPIYQYEVIRPLDGYTVRMRFTSQMLSQRQLFSKHIRERMSLEPLLPGKDGWNDFINWLVYMAQKNPGPETADPDQDVLYWLREWFKRGHEAETIDDLQTGYVVKGQWRYFQVQRVLEWMKQRVIITQPELWAILEPYEPKRDYGVRLKDGTRRLWGLKESFIYLKEGVEGEQRPLVEKGEEIEPEEEDISFLFEEEQKE